MFDISSHHVRPIPLLDSDVSTEESDDMIPPRRQRISYAALVNTHPPTRYHTLVLTFVCSVTFVQSLQLYLPIILGLYLLCSWELPTSAMSLLAISYPISGFISPLLQAVLSGYSLRVRLTLALIVSMFLLLGSAGSRAIQPLVILRCIAGILSVPESVLTQLWAHVYHQSRHQRCRQVIAASYRAGLALSILLLAATTLHFRLALGCSAAAFLIPVVMSWWITETPLMLLRQGKYSLIMKSIGTVFKGATIDSLRLQDLDLSDDLSRQSWNPVYMYSERCNRKNIFFVYVYKMVQGLTLFSLLCSLPLFVVSSTGCLTSGAATDICTIQPQPNINTVSQILALAFSSIIATNLISRLKLKHDILISAFLGAIAFALMSACIFNKSGNIAVLCFAVVSVSSFHSAVCHLSSTISVSIAGECLAGLIFTLALILAKITSDASARTIFILCSVLMCGVFVSAFVVEMPLTKDTCHQMTEVEMDDPLETIEMELEIEREESEGEREDSEEEREEEGSRGIN